MVNLPENEYTKPLVKHIVSRLNQLHSLSSSHPALVQRLYGAVYDNMEELLRDELKGLG